MGIYFRLAASLVGLLFAASCQTYPYAASFSACDSSAGSCYRACETYADHAGDYAACHADCEYEADICFANAYEPYRYAGSSYGPTYISPWYGSYGAWYPQTGYVVSLGYLSSSRYGYSRPGYRTGHRYDRNRHQSDRRRGRSDRERQGRQSAPPRTENPRYDGVGDGGRRKSGSEPPSSGSPSMQPPGSPSRTPPRPKAPLGQSQDSEPRSPVKERSVPDRPH